MEVSVERMVQPRLGFTQVKSNTFQVFIGCESGQLPLSAFSTADCVLGWTLPRVKIKINPLQDLGHEMREGPSGWVHTPNFTLHACPELSIHWDGMPMCNVSVLCL